MPAPESSPEYSLPIAEIRARLHATHQTGRDPILGAKHEFLLQDGRGALEVFPTAGITRVDTPSALIQVAVQPRVETGNGQGITLDLSDAGVETALTLHPDGAVLFSCVPGAPEPSTTAPDATSSTNVPLARSGASEDHDSAAHIPTVTTRPPSTQRNGSTTPGAPAASEDRDTKEAEPRVQLTGRLGRTPTFRTSPRGTQIGSFSLAVHGQDGATTWHSIVAFGTRAEQLQHRVAQGELGKGQEVNVVGYQHTREMPTKTGSRTVTEIHAVAVMKRS